MAKMGFTIGNGGAPAVTSIFLGIWTAAAVLIAVEFALGALASPLFRLGGEETAVLMALLLLILTRRATEHRDAGNPTTPPRRTMMAMLRSENGSNDRGGEQ